MSRQHSAPPSTPTRTASPPGGAGSPEPLSTVGVHETDLAALAARGPGEDALLAEPRSLNTFSAALTPARCYLPMDLG